MFPTKGRERLKEGAPGGESSWPTRLTSTHQRAAPQEAQRLCPPGGCTEGSGTGRCSGSPPC